MPPMPKYLAGRAVNVIRVLLATYPKSWNVRELARQSAVSVGWASMVSKALISDRLALRDTSHSGLQLTDPFRLLQQWADATNLATRVHVLEYFKGGKILFFFGPEDVLL